MATLGKAAGVFGAFAAGAPEIVETLVQRARPYVYTTASPPLLAVALMKSLELVEGEEWRRERLRRLVALLRERLQPGRWRLAPSDTAIQPLVIGASAQAVAVSETLARGGLLVPAIRPPTVPQGTARLRISLSAAHEPADVERLAVALNTVEGQIEPPRRQGRQGDQ
jgi:8-amino-7-oxononanoate synthase